MLLLLKYGGDLALSAIGIVTSIQTLILMPITGLMQGQQPLISYNFGARKIDRVKETLKYAIVGATVIAGIGFIAVQFFTKNIVYLFNNEEDVVALCSMLCIFGLFVYQSSAHKLCVLTIFKQLVKLRFQVY